MSGSKDIPLPTDPTTVNARLDYVTRQMLLLQTSALQAFAGQCIDRQYIGRMQSLMMGWRRFVQNLTPASMVLSTTLGEIERFSRQLVSLDQELRGRCRQYVRGEPPEVVRPSTEGLELVDRATTLIKWLIVPLSIYVGYKIYKEVS